MSEREISNPEVIPFKGLWANLEGMHNVFEDTEFHMSYPSAEIDGSRTVHWIHDLDKSDQYIFAVKSDPVVADGPYTVYNLSMTKGDPEARLYVYRDIGRLAHEESDDIREAWQVFQMEAGLAIPNQEDILNFRKVFTDFCREIERLKKTING